MVLQADSAAYQAEKQVKELGDKVPEATQKEITDQVASLRESIQNDDLAGMKSGMETLQQKLMAMGQAMYQQPGADGQPGAGPQEPGAGGSKPNDDGVVDAEFTDSDK